MLPNVVAGLVLVRLLVLFSRVPVQDLTIFEQRASAIIAKRYAPQLQGVADKDHSRDLFAID